MNGRKLDIAISGFSWLCGLMLLGTVATLIGFLLFHGISTIKPALVFGNADPLTALLLKRPVLDGLFPAMVGTLILVILSVGFAAPVGLAAGIYMGEYAGERPKKLLGLFLDILAAIPSIIVGLFGFSMAVFLHQHFSQRIYPCLLISSVSLAFLVLPYLVRSTQAALEDTPAHVRNTAPALGATKLQNIRHVLLPNALPGITSGIVLSIGRCAEDTAVIMLTGVVATAGIPGSLLSSYEALPFYIFYISSQYGDQQELAGGYGAALILLVMCALLFMVAFFIRNRLARRYHYRL